MPAPPKGDERPGDTLASPGAPEVKGFVLGQGPAWVSTEPPDAATLPARGGVAATLSARGRFEGVKGADDPPGPVAVDAAPWPVESAGFEQRYEARGVLGEGGVGEVRSCRDRLVGREVALKVLRPGTAESAEARERFVREARVQGQLEHPAVVPVYDLGLAPGGEAYFTMRRVRGKTLDEIVRALAAGDPAVREKYTRRRLLTALLRVCLAIDFAHRRGVLHRDLKPANVILGDFGEVYVLDWGLAKVAGADDPAFEPLDDPVSGHTLQGAMLGTPGYMAPEQVRGENERLDGRADVYALGAILFEIVALMPLHDASSVREVLGSTLFGVEARPSKRGRADVPPELEAICVRATALDPAERYPTARALSDDLERFLDGDRHETVRRELAAAHVAAARAALDRAAAGGDARAERALALRETASALALDAGHAEALATMVRLLVDVPDEVPPEAQAGLDAVVAAARRETAKHLATRFVSWTAFLPLALWMGVRSPAGAAFLFAAVLTCGAVSWSLARRATVGLREGFALLALSSVAAASVGAIFGPFLIAPGMAATNTMFFAASAERPARRVVLLLGALVVLAPFLLEALGVVPPSFAFRGGALEVLPRAAMFPPLATTASLLLISVAMVVIPGLAMGRLHDKLSAAERRSYLQAWNLRQLVPSAARGGLGGGEGGEGQGPAAPAAALSPG
ncbi:MAG TPA: serine/threonine-protein kinase [Polyangiaceae bacterium]|nr:serine/threonine-protein kinase [Polyangiaceae bacterium]